MTVTVDVVNDANYIEGGHALIRFPGLRTPTGPGRLRIEPLNEEFDSGRRVELNVTGTIGPFGLTFAVGNGALDGIEVGTPVAITIDGTGVTAETVWPNLPTLRQVSTRIAVRRPLKDRVIVEPRETKSQRFVPPQQQPQESQQPETQPSPAEPLERHEDTTISTDPPTVQPGVVGMTNPAPRGQWAIFAVAGLAAGVLFGAVGGHFLWPAAYQAGPQKPQLQVSPSKTANMTFPSPYDLLTTLPTSSPTNPGIPPNWNPIDRWDLIQLLRETQSGKSDAENSFWSRWAMRVALEGPAGQSKTNHGVAFALTAFADDMYDTTDPATRALAVYLWELAAVGGSCRAMDEIAEALKSSSDSAAAARVSTWKARFADCKAQRQ